MQTQRPSLQQTKGQAVRFECRVAGSSPIEVSWMKDGEPLQHGGEFSMSYDDNTAVLEISHGEMRHSGEYTCVATNSVGSASCRAKLTLQEPRFPPLFDRKLSPKEVTVGDSIELECHMTGSAPIKVTWSKDHKDIRSGGNYKISCVENTAGLSILKADKGDSGRYFCHASNDMGKDSCSCDITVKGIGPKITQEICSTSTTQSLLQYNYKASVFTAVVHTCPFNDTFNPLTNITLLKCQPRHLSTSTLSL
uniref:Ig-like domain-containing protein n=1 Tax=Sphaeramia orbicularis TaxID=375764 RepID=A0A672ZYT0_9TELE